MALGAVRLTRLGLDERSAARYSTSIASACGWTATGGAYLSNLGIRVDAGVQLAYDIQDSFPAFEATEIGGYPAVRLDKSDSGTCRFWIGIAGSQSIIAEARSLDISAPPLCEKAEALAVEVIDALRSWS